MDRYLRVAVCFTQLLTAQPSQIKIQNIDLDIQCYCYPEIPFYFTVVAHRMERSKKSRVVCRLFYVMLLGFSKLHIGMYF